MNVFLTVSGMDLSLPLNILGFRFSKLLLHTFEILTSLRIGPGLKLRVLDLPP